MIQKLAATYEFDRQLLPLSEDTPRHEFSVRMIDSVDELEACVSLWQRLSETSVHCNLMYDSDFLIPAIKHLSDGSVKVLVVEAPQKSNPNGPPVWCGLLALRKKSQKRFRPRLTEWETWMHEQSFDGTPLLRDDCAAEVLNTILNYLATQQKATFLHLNTISNEGRFSQVMTDVIRACQIQVFCRDSYTRACLRPERDAETYIQKHVSKSVAKTQRRLSRRLAEQGLISLTSYRNADSADEMIKHFLRLEGSGWKGHSGTALICQSANREFFQEMVRRSMLRNKLSFLALNLDNKPIAMLCDLYSGGIGASFKTTFDETLGEFSPGTMIELKNIEYMHDLQIDFMDSCTMPENQAINRIWGQRIRFQNLTIPLGGQLARLGCATLPLLKELRNKFFPRKNK